MTDATVAFVGRVPEHYDRYLTPLLFDPFAEDLVGRLAVRDGMRVLEVGCGTGIVTRRLVARLAGRGDVVATDLNEAMLAHARARLEELLGAPVYLDSWVKVLPNWRRNPAALTRLGFPEPRESR